MSIKHVLKLTLDSKIGETSSSEFAIEGGTPSFDLVPFRVLAGKNPNINTFVVALRHNSPNIAHYGRIIEGTEMNTQARPFSLQQDDAYGMKRSELRPSEQSPHITRTMQFEILGELHCDDAQSILISEPRSLPHTGQDVFEIPADIIPKILDIPSNPNDGLFLGKIESGGKEVPFLLPNTAVARHISILGKTGVGKSYAAGVLIEELFKKRIPILSFDVLGDMQQTTIDLNGRHIVAGTSDFKIPYSILGLREFLSFIPNLTSDQQDIIASAYGGIFDDALSMLDTGKTISLPYQKLLDSIDSIGSAIGSKATVNARRRAEAGVTRSNLLTDRPIMWPDLLGKSSFVNIYVGHLDQYQRNLAVGAAARILQRLRRRKTIPPFVLVIDEAHLFLPAGQSDSPSTSVLRELVRTARHDEIGLVLLTQSPSSMDKQILLTCNTRLLFALEPEDLRVVSGQIGDLPEQTINRIPRMARGKAVVASGMDIMRHPMIIQIREREITKHIADTPDMFKAVQEWRENHQ